LPAPESTEVAAFYDDFAADYSDSILTDFDAASRRDGERLDPLLRPRGAKRVLDVACGNGLQSLALAELGYSVTGVDVSSGMIAQAKRNAQRRGVTVEWVAGDWHELGRLFAEPFDALICWGNSLSHVADADDLAAALGEMAAVTKSAGVCSINLRDWDRVMAERPKGIVRQVKETTEGRLITFDVWRYPSPETMVMELFILRGHGDQWNVRRRETTHRMITRSEFESAVAQAGFAVSEVTDLGGHNLWMLEKKE